MKYVAAFHCLNAQRHLYRKLASLQWCYRVVVVFDGRMNEVEHTICSRFDNVDIVIRPRELDVPPKNQYGETQCEEGALRQCAWDHAARYEPDWIILGDVDETLTPGAREAMERRTNDTVDVLYLRIANLTTIAAPMYYGQRIPSGDLLFVDGDKAAYSFNRVPTPNLRGALCRWRPGVKYRYDTSMWAHCRAEPNPPNPRRAQQSAKRFLVEPPVVLHWKWIYWNDWLKSAAHQNPKDQAYWEGVKFSVVPDEWLAGMDDEYPFKMGKLCAHCGSEAWGPFEPSGVIFAAKCQACDQGVLTFP